MTRLFVFPDECEEEAWELMKLFKGTLKITCQSASKLNMYSRCIKVYLNDDDVEYLREPILQGRTIAVLHYLTSKTFY